MRSRAESLRRGLEWALRLAALALLVVALVRLLRPPETSTEARADGATVRTALARWTAAPQLREAHVTLDHAPRDTVRDWLAALRRAGVQVTWSGAPLPLAVAVEPVPDPAGGARVLVAAGRPVHVADAAGALDSLRPRVAGASLALGGVAPPLIATLGGDTARAGAPDSLVLRPVLVLGRAGWESKFTAAALEERGWTVVARFAVAPGVTVEQGRLGAIDTARFAAVVALDETAAPWARAIAAYVRRGGGLVLGPEAARLPALASLAPGVPGAVAPGAVGALASAEPRRGLPLAPIARLRPDAVPLERRGDAVAVAARREGSGRVVQVGYAESWRWRMAGGERAPVEHRRWWAELVSAAAHAPAVPPRAAALDDAPLPRLLDALGPPAETPPVAAGAPASRTGASWWLFAGAALALLGEWASRRLRGAR